MSKEYKTQEQFDKICESLINGNFHQAVDEVIEYGFYAGGLRVMFDNTEWVHSNEYIDSEDFYQVIEYATVRRRSRLIKDRAYQ